MAAKQLQLFAPPKKPKRRQAFNPSQWAAIETTYVSAREAMQACPGVNLREVCKITADEGWGDKRVRLAVTYGTRLNWKQKSEELMASVRGEHPNASLGVGFDQRPYKHRNPFYPSFADWLKGHQPAEAAVARIFNPQSEISNQQ